MGIRDILSSGAYQYNTPFASNVPIQQLIQMSQQNKANAPRGFSGEEGEYIIGNSSKPQTAANIGNTYIHDLGGGRYSIFDKSGFKEGDKFANHDIYDASGQYLGGDRANVELSGHKKLMGEATKALAMAFIGGGIGGAFGMGPMAQPGGFFNPGMAPAGGGGLGMGSGAFLGEGAMSGVPAWDGALTGVGQGLGTGSGAFLGEGTTSGIPSWDIPGSGAFQGGMGGSGGLTSLGGGASSGGGMGSYIKQGLGALGGMGGGGSNLLGLGSTVLGALSGGQGQSDSSSSTRSMDPRMDSLFYGDLAPRTQGVLGNQMSAAQGAGSQLLNKGQGLLGQTEPTTATNPYLKSIADDMQRRTTEMLGQNNLAIRGNAIGAGALGGSRQGVAEGIASSRAADYLQGNLANLYGTAYQGDQNRLRQDWAMGSGMVNQGLNVPFQPLQNTAGIYAPFNGYGTTTQNQESGGGWQGAVGGALAGASLGRSLGWW